MTHEDSIYLAVLRDEIRKQIGMKQTGDNF